MAGLRLSASRRRRICCSCATGAMTLAFDPTSSLQAATKQYADTRVSRSGDTLTGALVLATDPTPPLQAATKGYVDTRVACAPPKADGTLAGALTLSAESSLSMQAATKNYVDAQASRWISVCSGVQVAA